MNILAIDFGVKRMGLAWVQSGINVVLPFGVVDGQKWKTELPKLIREEKVDKLIVGNPLGLESQENFNTDRVAKFVEELQGFVDTPIELVDERFTTKQAQQMGGDATLDEKSAMLILQSYLDSQ
jgi:putative Holliday junction resolvase